MDTLLTDLDSLSLTVRNTLARGYIDESIRAYRAGSYKAAIVSIWVAVTFDILAKIRELSEMGDAPAAAHIGAFDANVQSNNVTKLLQIEAGLLEDAEVKFGFLDPIARRHFERMQQDRHLCAHPAFTMDGLLFTPEPELVRLYIVEAIKNLLSQRPVQGKTVLTQFDTEFRSAAFPIQPEQIVRFTEARYLRHLRANVILSFATVVLKAIFKQTPAGWDPKVGLLPSVLQAIKQHSPAIWITSILPVLVSMIEAADDEHLPHSYALLSDFDDLRGALTGPARTKLLAFVENMTPSAGDVRAFQSAVLPDFADAAKTKYDAADRVIQAAVVTRFPLPAYWPGSVQRLRDSGGWRVAESNFAAVVAPFAEVASAGQLAELLNAITSNDQVWGASGIPGQLTAFVDQVTQRQPPDAARVLAFVTFVDERGWRDAYEDVLDRFAKAGVAIPPPAPEV